MSGPELFVINEFDCILLNRILSQFKTTSQQELDRQRDAYLSKGVFFHGEKIRDDIFGADISQQQFMADRVSASEAKKKSQ
jgi:hypothetical protein